MGASRHGLHFSGEGLGRIEKEGKAKEALTTPRLFGWGCANKGDSVGVEGGVETRVRAQSLIKALGIQKSEAELMA